MKWDVLNLHPMNYITKNSREFENWIYIYNYIYEWNILVCNLISFSTTAEVMQVCQPDFYHVLSRDALREFNFEHFE